MKRYLIFLVLFMSACSPTSGPDKTVGGAILGAGWGAGAGAVIGNQIDQLGPGAAVGAGFGAGAGMMTGAGLDVMESTELAQEREIEALKVQIAANNRMLARVQHTLDTRDRKLTETSGNAQIFFDQGRASLRSGDVAQLERIANAIKINPYIGKIEIHGHSDDTSNGEKNERLSEARARTVATFLGAQGVSLDSIQIFSHGAKRPLATNETDTGRQLNRRAEIVVLK